jgi:hypothetical protein
LSGDFLNATPNLVRVRAVLARDDLRIPNRDRSEAVRRLKQAKRKAPENEFFECFYL